jgi:hypothetical protein
VCHCTVSVCSATVCSCAQSVAAAVNRAQSSLHYYGMSQCASRFLRAKCAHLLFTTSYHICQSILVQVEYLGLKLLFDVMDVRDDEKIDADALTLYAAEHNDYALVSLSSAFIATVAAAAAVDCCVVQLAL